MGLGWLLDFSWFHKFLFNNDKDTTMIVCGIDLETTGLDVVNDRIIEVGACLWEDGKQTVAYSSFVKTDKPITPEITNITGITSKMVDQYGIQETNLRGDFLGMIESSDAVMAHNGTDFDFPMIVNCIKRNVFGTKLPTLVDSKTDIPYRCLDKSRHLNHLAAAHGFVNPFPHRALFDVMTMLKIASMYDMEEIVRRAKSPSQTIEALVSYDDRQLAKDHGFHWDASPLVRKWVKTIKVCDPPVDYPFKIKVPRP